MDIPNDYESPSVTERLRSLLTPEEFQQGSAHVAGCYQVAARALLLVLHGGSLSSLRVTSNVSMLPRGSELKPALRLDCFLGGRVPERECICGGHPEEDVKSMFRVTGANVIVTGHTHMPYIRALEDGTGLLVNVGSVGRSKERTREPSFAILTVRNSSVEAEIRRLSYNSERTISAIRESSIPNFYADFLMSI
jgi:predicted phosphodiesterase